MAIISGTIMVISLIFAVAYLAEVLGDLFNPRERRVWK